MFKLSIVIPVYFNEKNLEPMYEDLKEKVLDKKRFDYEIIMVNDGSKDDSWEVMQALAKKDKQIRNIKLSKNFGSHAAILCGLSKASGDCAIVKAADMQEPSELILQMFAQWEDGDNVVLAVREDRKDSKKDSLFANLYYSIMRKFAMPNMPKTGFDVFLLDKKVIKVLELMDEKNSAITGQILWSGFKTSEVKYIRKEREIGKSRWTLQKKMRLVLDSLFSFTNLPITAVLCIGAFSCIGSVIWAVLLVILRLTNTIGEVGWTSLFVFQLFSFGVIMLTLGILGEYLWRTFDAARKRPAYIIEKEHMEDDRKESRG